MLLQTLSTGDELHHYEKTLLVHFTGPRKVLSTSLYNGGYKENLTGIYNYDCKLGAGMGCEVLAQSYREHMALVSCRLGLKPEAVTGVSTAADMENVAIIGEQFKELQVTAIVTGGIETNGGRAGDPADYYRPIEKPDLHGTINIMLIIDCDMPESTLVRALVTCTEAKTAALQELMGDSRYSSGLATGSGTDQTIIVANPTRQLYLEGAGKHAKMGELIGKAVKAAVKEALAKQSNLTPQRQHHVLRRWRRYGITQQLLWEEYRGRGPLNKAQFVDLVDSLGSSQELLPLTSLYIHILDQLSWQLISGREALIACEQLLNALAGVYNLEPVQPKGTEEQALIKGWQEFFLELLVQRSCTYGKEADK